MTVKDLKAQLKLPIIAAPMFLVSGTDLLIAASKAGILGTMPALNARTNKDLVDNLNKIHNELVINNSQSPLPYGINLIVHPTNTRLIEDLQVCIQYKVPVIITSLGANKEVIDAVHVYGGIVLHDVTNKRHAQKAIEAGVDGLIAVCNGAGGHAGTTNPFALMDEMRSFYDGPIALAGCINHAKSVKAATVLGADFAYMGTRFIATKESQANDDYKQMIINSASQDIIYTNAVSGVHASFLKESIQKAGINLEQKGEEDFSKLNDSGSKAWKDVWSAGQGVSGIVNCPTVQELVDEIFNDYKNL